MKRRIYLLIILVFLSSTLVFGQSGDWGYMFKMSIYNNHNHDLKAGGSHTFINLYTVRNGNNIDHDYGTGNFRLNKGKWANFYSNLKIRSLDDKFNELKISMKIDCDNYSHKGSDWSHNIITLFTGNIGYEYARICDGSYRNSECTRRHNLYRRVTGYGELWVFPKNIKIAFKSGPQQILPSVDKIKIEAPIGYTSDTYEWVYATNYSGNPATTTWTVISNPNIKGKHSFEASGKDIYGSDFESKMKHGAKTTIALRYRIYKDQSNTRAWEYSNVVDLTNQISAPHIVKVETVSNKCNGDSQGSIKVFFDRAVKDGETINIDYGALNPLKYTNFESDNTITINDLPEGKYTLQVSGIGKTNLPAPYDKVTLYSNSTDSSFHRTVILKDPPKLNFKSPSKEDILCYNDNTGKFKVEADGGVGDYKLHWKKAGEASFITENFSTANVTRVENLSAGTYEFYVTDNNDCFVKNDDGTAKTEIVTINQPTKAITYNIIDSSIKEPSGYGLSNGSFSIAIDGGTPDISGNYTVEWKNKTTGEIISTVTNNVSENKLVSHIHSIPAGIYFATITDSNECQLTTEEFLLEQPDTLAIQIEETNSNRCFNYADGELTAHAKGGVKNPMNQLSPYKYQWFVEKNQGYVVIPNETDSVLSKLKEGNYKVEIEDYSWKTNTISAYYTMTAPSQIEVNIASKTDILCYGENTGRVVINTTGGSGEYKLYWKSQDDSDYPVLPKTFDSPSQIIIDSLEAGTYNFYVADKQNCSPENADGTIKVETITLVQPTKALEFNFVDIKEPSANGLSNGSLSIKVDGGTPDEQGKYRAVWKNKETGEIISRVTDSISEGYFFSTIPNIPIGIYTITITDSNGCSLEKEYTINEPEPFVLTLLQTDSIYCHGDATGRMQIYAIGGVKNPASQTLPYKYTWFEEINGTYILIPNETYSILKSRKAGNYKVEVEDYSWIPNILTYTHTITEPPLLTYQTTAFTNILCYGDNTGSISIEASGGTGRYWLYLKMPDETYFPEVPQAFETETNITLNELYAGTYEYYVTDDNGCIILENGSTKTITVTLTQPAKAIEYEFTDVVEPSGFSLSNGTISIKVDGGTPNAAGNYFPVWKNKETELVLTTVTNKIEAGYFISTLHSIPKGTYIVDLVDDNGCNLVKEVSINEPKLLEGEIEETRFISCNGMSDGELQIHARGGIVNPSIDFLPYKYTWYKETNGTFDILQNQSDSILSNITAGNYKVEVEDYSWLANKITKTFNLKEPIILSAKAADAFITCGQTADISVTVEGGTAPYKYEWNTGDTTSTLKNLTAGTYFVYVTDSRGCETTAFSKVSQPTEIKILSKINNPICYDSSDGNISVQISGGTAPYTYAWSNGTVSQNLTNVKAGRYTLIVTDANNCSWSESFLLTNPDKLIIELGGDRTLCKNQKLTLSPEVADPKTTFSWTSTNGFSSQKSKVTLDKVGIYNLQITDSKGCQATDQLKIEKDNTTISSEMVVSSQVFVNDTIVIVNISSPHPDSTQWLVKDDKSIKIVEQTEHLIKVIFFEEGQYSLGMRSHKNNCFQDVTKNITVLRAENNHFIEIGETTIKNFLIYPNPSSGTFDLKVELAHEGSIRLRLVDIGHGKTVNDKKYHGKKEYLIPYNINVPTGAYIMILETASGNRALKIVIK